MDGHGLAWRRPYKFYPRGFWRNLQKNQGESSGRGIGGGRNIWNRHADTQALATAKVIACSKSHGDRWEDYMFLKRLFSLEFMWEIIMVNWRKLLPSLRRLGIRFSGWSYHGIYVVAFKVVRSLKRDEIPAWGSYYKPGQSTRGRKRERIDAVIDKDRLATLQVTWPDSYKFNRAGHGSPCPGQLLFHCIE